MKEEHSINSVSNKSDNSKPNIKGLSPSFLFTNLKYLFSKSWNTLTFARRNQRCRAIYTPNFLNTYNAGFDI